jgi:uncharacterized protein YhfF
MPEGLTPDQAAFWAAFLASPAAPPDADARFHSVFAIGSGSDAGATLILSGTKTATSSLPAEFQGIAPPIPGSLSLLTGAGGRPMGIVETLSMAPLTLSQMDEAFSASYAEWPNHTGFVQGMIEWYQSVDPGFTAETPLLAERFRVIWPTPKSPT